MRPCICSTGRYAGGRGPTAALANSKWPAHLLSKAASNCPGLGAAVWMELQQRPWTTAPPHLHIPAAFARQHMCQEGVAGVGQRAQLPQRAQRLPLRRAQRAQLILTLLPLAAGRAAAH